MQLDETTKIQDSTKLQSFMSCERKYFFEYILGYRPEAPIHALEFGKSFHDAKEVLLTIGYSQRGIDAAMNAFLTTYRKVYGEETDLDFSGKHPGNVELALNKYVSDYADDNFQVLFTEVGFSMLVGLNRTLYGKLDAVIEKEGKVYILETKTAGALWSYWFDSWQLKFQISAYTNFLYSYYPKEQVGGVIIDGTIFRKKEVENLRTFVYKTPEKMLGWLSETNYFFTSLEANFKALPQVKESDTVMECFPRRTESCVKYNRICPFFDVCQARENPYAKRNLLPSGYKIEFWNPVREEQIKHNIKV